MTVGFGAQCGAQRIRDNDRFDWDVPGGIDGCHCSLAINQQAPVPAMGLSCLAAGVQGLLVAVLCSHCCAVLLSPHCCAWEQFDNSNGHTPGLAGGQGTSAVPVLDRLELLWNSCPRDCEQGLSPGGTGAP